LGFRTKEEEGEVCVCDACNGINSSFHLLPLGIPSFAARPLNTSSQWYVWPLWPLTLPVMALLWLFGQAFVSDTYQLPTLRTQTWVIPRFAFQVGTPLGLCPLPACRAWGLYPVCKFRDKSSLAWPEGSILSAS
jgi:hypothetical protein